MEIKRSNGKPVKWAAKCPGTKELILTGLCERKPVEDYLAPFGLTPKIVDGKAELWIVAGDLKWKGFKFQELSVTILLDGKDAPDGLEPVFLVGAVNTNRFFAWSERAFFKLPYISGDVSVTSEWPMNFRASKQGQTMINASCGEAREASANGNQRDFHCVVYSPSGSKEKPAIFYSKLLGEGRIWPWDDTTDTLDLGEGEPAFKLLKEANFSPLEWSYRPDCLHQKSKSYRESPI